MKLSENFIKRATSVALHVGEDFGLSPGVSLPVSAHHYWTYYVTIEHNSMVSPCVIPYSLWIDDDFFYICIDSSIFCVRRYMHRAFSIEEMVVFVFLVFIKHKIFIYE